MEETKEQNQNFQTLEKIKIIVSAAFALYVRISIILTIVGLSYLSYYLVNKYFDISTLYTHLLNKLTKPMGLWTTVSIIFIIGILLSLFRSKQQFWYGFVETIFALVSCYFAVKSINPSTEVISVLLLVGSTLYLIVRGFSNLLEGVKNPFWIKTELVRLGINMNAVSSESITKMLKDEEVLVNILTGIIRFISCFV
jgi:uncharacterized membrane protein